MLSIFLIDENLKYNKATTVNSAIMLILKTQICSNNEELFEHITVLHLLMCDFIHLKY